MWELENRRKARLLALLGAFTCAAAVGYNLRCGGRIGLMFSSVVFGSTFTLAAFTWRLTRREPFR